MLETLGEEHAEQGLTWGRAWEVNWLSFVGCTLLTLCTPFIVFFFYLACDLYGGSLTLLMRDILQGSLTLTGIWAALPPLTLNAVSIFVAWVGLQVLFALALPDLLRFIFPGYAGGLHVGSVTPAGNQLSYQINGLQAWLLSHLFFIFGAFVFHWFSPTVIFDHWGSLLWVANIAGVGLALFAYLKAYRFPSHSLDRKFTESGFYNFFMGIELNPRIRKFDFKLFFNGRPGIIAWTLINLSFAAKQLQLHGSVTNSMILVNVLQALYVFYFFWNERWYLKTIDMSHDHFGWMLAWGDLVWLPWMYTLQGLYLVYHPTSLSPLLFAGALALGLVGFWLFLSANGQKERFRNSDGNTRIWGKRPSYLPCTFTAADGTQHLSKLLISGWWGLARHLNYTGDLLGALAYSLACGFEHILPYFYVVYMVILLVHRCIRDEKRCLAKYGAVWKEYCRRVPYRLVPGVF